MRHWTPPALRRAAALLIGPLTATAALADGVRLPAQTPPLYRAECGACHVAYPPALLHLGLLAGLSLWRRQNLARPMLSGRIAGRGADLAARNHGGLAALLLTAVLAYWGWEWQHAPASTADVLSSPVAWPAHDHDEDEND